MKEEDFMREVCAYQAAMAIARNLVSQGVITEDEYANIDTILTKKHGLSLGSIFR